MVREAEEAGPELPEAAPTAEARTKMVTGAEVKVRVVRGVAPDTPPIPQRPVVPATTVTVRKLGFVLHH